MIETYVAEVQRVLVLCAGMFATEHRQPLSCGYYSRRTLGCLADELFKLER
jgi:hypothetical protein